MLEYSCVGVSTSLESYCSIALQTIKHQALGWGPSAVFDSLANPSLCTIFNLYGFSHAPLELDKPRQGSGRCKPGSDLGLLPWPSQVPISPPDPHIGLGSGTGLGPTCGDKPELAPFAHRYAAMPLQNFLLLAINYLKQCRGAVYNADRHTTINMGTREIKEAEQNSNIDEFISPIKSRLSNSSN